MRKASPAALALLAATVCAVTGWPASPVLAQDAGSTEPPADAAGESQERRSRGFGGPDQVDNTIAIDDETVSRIVERNIFEPWFELEEGPPGEARSGVQRRLLHGLAGG